MPTTLTNGIQLPDKGSVDWYSSMQSNYNLIDTHLGDTDVHVTAEDKANWNSKQGSLSQAQLDAIAQVATNTDDIATLQSGKANALHTHSSSDITDIGDYATKQYVDNSISGLVDSAPNALDTLNELAAALNDDANFASTVTNALSTKANSADLATVATSGSYNDLSNKPTINDSTITIQKNGSTVDTFTTNGSAKTINISVPTKTSDLTNDSNFVDTSNSAVSSGITSAKVTSYDSHIADTDIHVTTADKTKWNNGVSQAFVFRYSSTALVASSTNSNTLLDNTDNLKVGDKVIDSSGVLFSITAIDTANSTFTIGSALVDLALDANVVHTSGEESITGTKRFGVVQSFTGYPSIRLYGTNDDINVLPSYSDQKDIRYTDKNNNIIAYFVFQHRNDANEPFRTCWRQNRLDGTANYYSVDFNNLGEFYPENNNAIKLGTSTKRWAEVYAINYYYGSNNVEFSTKFVTTDTAQTITGTKTFENVNIQLKSTSAEYSVSGGFKSVSFYDKNLLELSRTRFGIYSNGSSYIKQTILGYDSNNQQVDTTITFSWSSLIKPFLRPDSDNLVSLGTSGNRWKDVQTNLINGLTPSSLGMPSNTGYVDISSYFTNTGDGQTNSYTASANGWIYLNVVATKLIMQIRDSNNNVVYADMCNRSSDGTIYMTIPIGSGNKLLTQWFTSSSVTVTTARFIPCQGNV